MRNKPIGQIIAPAVSITHRKGRQRGLTLVELLVAISVLAFVAVLGWRGLDGIVRARIALTSDLEQTRGMQLAFAQLQNDCAHLVTTATIANRPPLAAEQGRLTLIRTVFADNQPSRLQVVAYRVNGGVLTRRESAATRDLNELDTYWQAALNDSDISQAVTLQSGVAAMTMWLWSPESNAWRVADTVAQTGSTPGANPVAGVTALQPTWTGLEVSLQLQGRDAGMLKTFLLGAV
jgi:general secretion pathway protein J